MDREREGGEGREGKTVIQRVHNKKCYWYIETVESAWVLNSIGSDIDFKADSNDGRVGKRV